MCHYKNFNIFQAIYVSLKADAAPPISHILSETKPVSIEGCLYEFQRDDQNITLSMSHLEDSEGFELHQISYLYFSVIGTALTIGVAFIISLFTGLKNPLEIDQILLAPCIRKYFKTNEYQLTAINDTLTKHSFDSSNNQEVKN